MGLLISRPSVFVWGPEACLSTVSVNFVGRRASTKENNICGSVKFQCFACEEPLMWQIFLFFDISIHFFLQFFI